MPIYFLFDFKNGDMVAIFVFDPHDNTVSQPAQEHCKYHYYKVIFLTVLLGLQM